jgi:hypothetical protein
LLRRTNALGNSKFRSWINSPFDHQTLKVTPAMAAGVSKRLWEMSDLVDVLDAWERVRKGAS